ncbi:MAG: non-ribosomal peptide synthetase, partial [Gammaproteobacteria bacterium]
PGPVQRVVPEAHLELIGSDLTEAEELLPDRAMPAELPDGDPALALFRRCAEAFVRQPFALSQQPPIRAMLAKLGAGRHAFVLVLHHIVGDRWSVGLLMKEVAALYRAYVDGLPSPLAALPIQFGDYAAWQRQAGGAGKHLDYWRDKLDGAPPLLELPTDRPRPAVNRYRGETYRFDFRPELRQRLAEFGKRENVTLFMTMAAALSVLLFRYSGNKDINIGYPVAGRNALQTTALIGFFVNTLILRSRIDPVCSFSELLGRIKQQALSDLEHQDVAFGQLVDALNPVRNAGHTPLFQVMLAVQNVPSATLRLPHLSAEPLVLDNAVAQFDLTLFVDEDQTRLQGGFEFNTDLFERCTVALWAERLQALLADGCRNPQAPLCNLNLLPLKERQQVLYGFNATREAFEQEPFIHTLFETQVERTPDACALVFAGRTLGYAQLNSRANRLAHYLLARGLRTEDRVAVFFERSFDMVVSLLGILKAGGAYVPVDPDYPGERLTYLFEDCRPSLLITARAMRARLPDAIGTTMPVIELDGDAYRSAAETLSERNPEPNALGLTPKHLAYLIYTSGSTGRPKGAMNEHAGVVNRLLWAQREYRLNAEDRVLQKTPYSFDVSVWEFFLPLMTGAVLVLAKPKGHQEPDYLMELIEAEAVTTLHFVPSMLQSFMPAVNAEQCRSLRRILCSGEALPRDLVQRVRADLPFVELHNLYGPTEAAIDVTAWRCRQEPVGAVPIGYPIANTAIHILDPFLNPVPVGVPGEIHIGGVQVGRGYFDKPDLTAERFTPDPFRVVDGSTRLYKTGDLARWLADGAIEYLGRNDFQVKLRGFRIELGEIEAKLKDYTGIRDALATVRDDDAHGKRLVAYLLND